MSKFLQQASFVAKILHICILCAYKYSCYGFIKWIHNKNTA